MIRRGVEVTERTFSSPHASRKRQLSNDLRTRTSSQDTPHRVRLDTTRILANEGKIAAIKFVREKTGLGLAQAKAYVEALASGGNPDEAARSVPPASGGCLPIVLVVLVIAGGLLWWLTR
jgi:ribosomal protein L7/L12